MAKLSLVPQSISSLEGRSASKFKGRGVAGLREAAFADAEKALTAAGGE
ncbi:MAG: hypothetical protein WA820_22305 [Bradyrhizobium sp.]